MMVPIPDPKNAFYKKSYFETLPESSYENDGFLQNYPLD